MLIVLLLLVPITALGLVLGMDRLEETLLRAPSGPADGATPAPTAVPAVAASAVGA